MAGYVIAGGIGIIVASVGWFFVIRSNRAKAEAVLGWDWETIKRKAKEKIEAGME